MAADTLMNPKRIDLSKNWSGQMHNVTNGTAAQDVVTYSQTIGVSGIYNVKNYGAVGDGAADDADDIQESIDLANSNGGGIVYIPPGIYLLSTSQTAGYNSSLLHPHTAVRIMGAGAGITILKVVDDYRTQWRGAAPLYDFSSTIISNWSVNDITFDFNGQNNLYDPSDTDTWTGYSSYSCVGAENVRNVTIERCEFINDAGYNCIILSGYGNSHLCENAIVRNCRFGVNGNAIPGNHDNDFTAIYTEVKNAVVENNVIDPGDAMRTENAAGIELHAPNSVASDNIITNIANGIYFGNDVYGTSVNQQFFVAAERNKITHATYSGIRVWGFTGDVYGTVQIKDNIISMNPTAANDAAMGIDHGYVSTSIWPANALATDLLDISGNVVSFPSTQDRSASSSYGITVSRANNTVIRGNSISYTTKEGIIWKGSDANNIAQITGNTLNQFLYSAQSGGILGIVNIANKRLQIDDNTLTNAALTSPFYVLGIKVDANAPLNVSMRGNDIAGCFYPALVDAIPTFSTIVIDSYAPVAPTSGYGAYSVGSFIRNSAPSAGGAPGWVCTTSGDPGTWKAMANLAA
jgi:parallel beta-helix repeat protein